MECVYSKLYKRESPVSVSHQRLNQLLKHYGKYKELACELKKLIREVRSSSNNAHAH